MMLSVRTTATLDPEVERLLRLVMKERGLSFKKALNEAVKAGLSPAKGKPARKFIQKTYSMGSEQGIRWDKALTIASSLEDDELLNKIALRH